MSTPPLLPRVQCCSTCTTWPRSRSPCPRWATTACSWSTPRTLCGSSYRKACVCRCPRTTPCSSTTLRSEPLQQNQWQDNSIPSPSNISNDSTYKKSKSHNIPETKVPSLNVLSCLIKSPKPKTLSLLSIWVLDYHYQIIQMYWIIVVLLLLTLSGGLDGGVCHCSPAVEAEHLWSVWDSQKQCAAERTLPSGKVITLTLTL